MMKAIQQAWLVIVLSLVFGAALAGVQLTLQPRIEANKLADALNQIPQLVPGATQGAAAEVAGRRVFRALDDAGKLVGWVVPAAGQGFADKLELLVGVNADASAITGLYVLDQKETPGLGDNITRAEWRAQFAGKSLAQPLQTVKTAPAAAQDIQAVTGATISSWSVVGIVNEQLARFRKELRHE